MIGLNRVLRTKEPRRKLLRSRSDKLLTTMRRIDNQKSFIRQDAGREHIELPFNKKTETKPGFQRIVLNPVEKNLNQQIYSKKNSKESMWKGNKENVGLKANPKGHGKSVDKTTRKAETGAKRAKIFMSDAFDVGIISEMESKRTFMLDTILRSAIMNR